VVQPTWMLFIVADVAAALLIVKRVEFPPVLGFALLTSPAQPHSHMLPTQSKTIPRCRRNLFFVFVVERIVVSIFCFPLLSAACSQAVSASVPQRNVRLTAGLERCNWTSGEKEDRVTPRTSTCPLGPRVGPAGAKSTHLHTTC
jgi:hypothetical protein